MVLQWSLVGQTVLEATCPAEGRCVFCRVPPEKIYYSGEASFSGDGDVCAHSALALVRVCGECKSKSASVPFPWTGSLLTMRSRCLVKH